MTGKLNIFGKTHDLRHVSAWRIPETDKAIEFVVVYLTQAPVPFKAPPPEEEAARWVENGELMGVMLTIGKQEPPEPDTILPTVYALGPGGKIFAASFENIENSGQLVIKGGRITGTLEHKDDTQYFGLPAWSLRADFNAAVAN